MWAILATLTDRAVFLATSELFVFVCSHYNDDSQLVITLSIDSFVVYSIDRDSSAGVA